VVAFFCILDYTGCQRQAMALPARHLQIDRWGDGRDVRRGPGLKIVQGGAAVSRDSNYLMSIIFFSPFLGRFFRPLPH